MGLHKGHTNNPHGRPRLLRGHKRQLCVRLDAKTHRNLKGCCRLWRCNTSEALRRILSDEAALLILRQAKPGRDMPVSAARFLADARRHAAATRAQRGSRQAEPAAPPPADFISEKELARLFKVDRLTLSRLRRKGALPHVVIGRMVRYPRAEMADWLTSLAERCRPRNLSFSGARFIWQKRPGGVRRKKR